MRYAQDATDYLKGLEYSPCVWDNIRRGNVDGCQKVSSERIKWNHNPQLMNTGKVDVKIRSIRLAGIIHVIHLLL